MIKKKNIRGIKAQLFEIMKKPRPEHQLKEPNFLPNIENSDTIEGTGAEGPHKVTKPKSRVAAECQIRQ